MTAVGEAFSVKSVTVKVTVVEWVRSPLVPVKVTRAVDGEENVHDRVELPAPVTLVGETVQAVLLVARPTIPAKPLRLVMLIVEDPGDPTKTVDVDGFALIWKS